MTKVFALFALFVLPFSVFSQQVLTIDRAIAESMNYVSEKLSAGAKVAVIKVEAPNSDLIDYINVECENYIANNTNLTLVGRRGLGVILRQRNIEDLNSADEDEILQVARLLGAEYAVFVEFSKRGEQYRFFVQAFDAETADIKGIQAFRVGLDEILADFTGEVFVSPAQQREAPQQDLAAVKEMLAQIDARLGSQPATTPEVVIIERSSDSQELANVKRELEELRTAMSAAVAAQQAQQQKPKGKRSRFFMAHRYMMTTPVDKSMNNNVNIMTGYEMEFGGLKRDKLIFTGTALIVMGEGYNTNSYHYDYEYGYRYYNNDLNMGWGGGFFLAPRIVNAGEVFKFVPGLNIGYWYYLQEKSYPVERWDSWSSTNRYDSESRWNEEMLWGGPDFRMMIGYRRAYLDLSYKMQMGVCWAGDPYYYFNSSYMSSPQVYYDYIPRFRMKHLWGIGFSFAIGKGNW